MTEYFINTLSDEEQYLKEDEEKFNHNYIKNNINQNTIKISNINNKKINLFGNNMTNNHNYTNLSVNEKNEIIPPKIIDKIICGSRRRKYPKGIKNMIGYFITFFLFIFFTIIFTLSINYTKKFLTHQTKTISICNKMLILIWFTTIISLITLTDAATSDPGRQRGIPISKNKFFNSKIINVVKGKKFILKYCESCKLIRDVRSFHCKKCGLCVERHDHHCGYLSNCVGAGNYHKFYIFVLVSLIHVFNIFWFMFYIFNKFSEQKIKGNVWNVLCMIYVAVSGGIFSLFLFTLSAEHTTNILKNKLTREVIKRKKHPEFNRGYKNNCREALWNKFPMYDKHNYF